MSTPRISWILAAIVMLGAASAHAQAPAGSYAQTCSNVQVSGNVLHARCRTMAGAMVDTQLTLPCNGSIDNIDGRLRCSGGPAPGVPPGSYLASCAEARVQNGVLFANCRRANQTIAAASLPLPCSSGRIDNLNGVLTCVGGAPAGSYAQTCANVQVAGNVLHARCRTMQGGMVDTALELPCKGSIDNINGRLTCTGAPAGGVPPGSYLQTCGDARVQNGVLYANCRRANQSVAQASLKLPCAGQVENLNGVLTCR
jgi:hypothetical protein